MKAVITFVQKAKAVIILCRRPSPDKKKYTLLQDSHKACTFFCPDLLAKT